MAPIDRPYGKDRPATSSESFIGRALTGGTGPSNAQKEMGIDRPSQKIITASAMDNVKLACPIETSIFDDAGSFAGGKENLKHSLTGASAVQQEVGAAGKVKHTIIPDH